MPSLSIGEGASPSAEIPSKGAHLGEGSAAKSVHIDDARECEAYYISVAACDVLDSSLVAKVLPSLSTALLLFKSSRGRESVV